MNYSEYKIKADELNAAVKANGTELIQGMYEAFFAKHPDMKFVSTLGYIPSFNDGDACEFSTDTDFDIDYIYNLSEEAREEMAIAFDGEGEELSDMDILENPDYEWEQYVEIKQDINEELLEKVYGYDWIVVAYKGVDGTVTFVQEGYDCGY